MLRICAIEQTCNHRLKTITFHGPGANGLNDLNGPRTRLERFKPSVEQLHCRRDLEEFSTRRASRKERNMTSRKIDFSDIPELSDEQLSRMRWVGRPTVGDELPRKLIAIRLDAKVLSWLRKTAEKNRETVSIARQ